MTPPLAEVRFETTLGERVDVMVRASRRLLGRFSWVFPVAASLLGSLTVVVAVMVLEPEEPASTAWGAGGITLAVLAVLLPPLVLLVPRITLRAALRRTLGVAPQRVTVTLTEHEITASDPLLRLSMSWVHVVRVDIERDRVVIAGRGATFFVPGRAFADAAQRNAFLELAQRLAASARAAAQA